MTEAIENGAILVRLRALVMERDDSSEVWVPRSPGILSNVSVIKQSIPVSNANTNNDVTTTITTTCCSTINTNPDSSCSTGNNYNNNNNNNNNTNDCNPINDDELFYEYVIYGHTIPEELLIFRCVIDRSFEYHKVMPTFHNWIAGGKKVGLIFQTAADGRAFDKGVHACLVQLVGDNPEEQSLTATENDEVFMTVDLPYTRYQNNNNQQSVESAATHASSPSSAESTAYKTTPLLLPDTEFKPYKLKSVPASSEEYSCTYESKFKPMCPESPHSLKKATAPSSMLHYSTKDEKQTLICRHCRKTYLEEENVKGSCEYAPDCVRTSIDTVTCIPCARSMIYHCMSDAEGEFAQPCECDTAEEGCSRRWIGLALLSILLPCLWCYPPLKVCHLCGVSCGACGGRHEPIRTTSNTR